MKSNTEKARAVVEAWQRNPGMAGEPDLQERIAQALAEERERALEDACTTVFGQCGSDNVAQRTVDAIRRLK